MAGRYLAVVFADLERHSLAWTRIPRERMVATVAEYRYLAESLAGQFGALYREWAGDGHMFLFESADTAVQFGLRLVGEWQRGRAPQAPALRVGCHFGECTELGEGEGWIGRANAIAKRAEAEAEPDTLVVTETVLDLVDLPLYELVDAGSFELAGDHLRARTLHRVLGFDGAALDSRPPEQLSAEDWFRKGAGLIGTALENSEEEAECYRQALGLRPDYPEAHNNLAVVLRAGGEEAEGGRHYREALRLRPDYPEAHSNYAALLAARGSLEPAAGHYRQALALRPDSVDARHGYAGLLARLGDAAGAAEQYEEVLRLRPDYPEAHSNYAIALEDLGRLDEAAGHYREALRLRPDYPEGHYNFALLLERSGDVAAAEGHYREALRLRSDYAEALNNLAALLHVAGSLEEANAHYREALRLRPEDPETHYNLGLLLRARGEEAEAEWHFRTAQELAPDVLRFRTGIEPPA